MTPKAALPKVEKLRSLLRDYYNTAIRSDDNDKWQTFATPRDPSQGSAEDQLYKLLRQKRTAIAQLWGEVRETVLALGVPLTVKGSGKLTVIDLALVIPAPVRWGKRDWSNVWENVFTSVERLETVEGILRSRIEQAEQAEVQQAGTTVVPLPPDTRGVPRTVFLVVGLVVGWAGGYFWPSIYNQVLVALTQWPNWKKGAVASLSAAILVVVNALVNMMTSDDGFEPVRKHPVRTGVLLSLAVLLAVAAALVMLVH